MSSRIYEIMKRFLEVKNQMAERGQILGCHLHSRGFPLRTVGITEMDGCALRIKPDRYGLNGHRVPLRDRLVAWSDFQFPGIHPGRFEGEQVRSSKGKEDRCEIEGNKECCSKEAGQCPESAELTLVDLVSEAHMPCFIEHIFRQKMNEGELLGPRFLNRINCADQAVLQARILFLDEPCQLRVGRRPPQRYDERFDNRYGDSDHQT